MIAHVVHRLAIGGLENGLVNLINATPADRFRHAIVCMTDFDPEFRARIRSPDVPVYGMGKRPGQDPRAQWRVWRLLRSIRPRVLHSRNLAALDALVPAACAGVAVRVHSEHGWDAEDPDGRSRKRIWLRRLHRPFVHHYVTVSSDLQRYLVAKVGVAASSITHIGNGVDTLHFHPAGSADQRLAVTQFGDSRLIVVGTVGRLDVVKGQGALVEALRMLSLESVEHAERMRLVLVGDGPLRASLEEQVARSGLTGRCWFSGARGDVANLLRGLDVFALPSLAEGISNTVLEAMATGLPVIATAVGGNPELVVDGETGTLVPRASPERLAAALRRYALNADLRRAHGAAGRRRACREFSLERMVSRYLALYDRLLVERLGNGASLRL